MATTQTVLECVRIAIRQKRNVIIHSLPGTGKTSLVNLAAQLEEADLILGHPSVANPTTYQGYGFDAGDHAEHKPYGDLYKLMNVTKRTVYFADDFGQALDSVQAPFRQLFHGGELAGKKISDEVVIIIATNRKEDKSGVRGLMPIMKSAAAWMLELDPDIDGWSKWALANNINPEVIAYVRFDQDNFVNFKATRDMSNYPCPRTWEKVSDVLWDEYPEEVLPELFSGLVGEQAGAKFYDFHRKHKEMPNPDLIILKPDSAPIPDETSQTDILYATCVALAARAADDTIDSIIAYANRLPHEFSTMLVMDCVERLPETAACSAFQSWAVQHSSIHSS